MPPRKSLPAHIHTSTPTRSSRNSDIKSQSQSTLKKSRSKREQIIGSSPDPIALRPSQNQSFTSVTKLQDGADTESEVELEEEKSNRTNDKEHNEDVNKENEEGTGEVDPEKEIEAWQDFAADHYEMVEQLPLELHRNFRLLRELDDGCLAQIQRLHELTRHYINERLELEKQLNQKNQSNTVIAEMETNEQDDNVPSVHDNDENNENDIEMKDATGDENQKPRDDNNEEIGKHAKEAKMDEKQDKDLIDGKQITEGIPESDGQGGLFISLPKQNDMNGTNQEEGAQVLPRLAFPANDTNGQDNIIPKDVQIPHEGKMEISNEQNNKAVQVSQSPTVQGSGRPYDKIDQAEITQTQQNDGNNDTIKKRKRPDGPHAHLPEIARLSREVVRTAEEKVAVAVGAYNAIDRHIRALDSALTAQEASILLGLRPSTLPSTNVDDALNLVGDLNVLPEDSALVQGGEEDEEEMTLGLPGRGNGNKRGRGGRRGRKGKRGNNRQITEDKSKDGDNNQQAHDILNQSWSIPADPNEPRYCYCEQVSYGEMVGCDNDECPIEWFHLACVGLQAPPTGKWWCKICLPKFGLGKGGSSTTGKVGNKNISGHLSSNKKKR